MSRETAIDRSRIHILGLSNGGLAVSQLAADEGSGFASMVFISPVFDLSAIRSASSAKQCNERPVLVVTGERDDRVPLRYVEEAAARMNKSGAKVALRAFDSADHFLMFSHRAQLLSLLEEWFRAGQLAGER